MLIQSIWSSNKAAIMSNQRQQFQLSWKLNFRHKYFRLITIFFLLLIFLHKVWRKRNSLLSFTSSTQPENYSFNLNQKNHFEVHRFRNQFRLYQRTIEKIHMLIEAIDDLLNDDNGDCIAFCPRITLILQMNFLQ